MPETSQPTIEENELLPEEAISLRDEMWDKINYALSLGVFTESEAKAWAEGFAACDRLEHMENLIEIIDDFIDSGERVVAELMSTLDTDLLTDSEKTEAEWQAEMLCYQDKWDLIKDLKITIKEVAHYKQKLIKILQISKLPSAESEAWLQKFTETSAGRKEGVVTRAAMAATERNAQYPLVQSRIAELLNINQFGEARTLLYQSQINFDERETLMRKIDLSEAHHFRTLAQST